MSCCSLQQGKVVCSKETRSSSKELPSCCSIQQGKVECCLDRAEEEVGVGVARRLGQTNFTPLQAASEDGDVVTIAFLLSEGAPVNQRGEDGHGEFPPLHLAVKKQHLETVKVLLAGGADVNALSRDKWTALAICVMNGWTDGLALLFDMCKGTIELNAPALGGNTAMHLAVDRAGNQKDRGHTVDLRDLRLLLENGADPNVVNEEEGGITPLERAALCGVSEIVAELLPVSGGRWKKNNGGGGGGGAPSSSEVPHPLQQVLFDAVTTGHSAVVKVLLEVDGVDVNFKIEGGGGGDDDVSRSEDDDRDSENGKESTNYLLEAALAGHTEVVKVLLDYGADMNIRDHNGETALHAAAADGRIQTVAELLLGEESTTTAGSGGGSAVGGAVGAENENRRKGRRLPLGGIVNARTELGTTALRLAVLGGEHEVATMLVDKGAEEANLCRNPGESNEDYVARVTQSIKV